MHTAFVGLIIEMVAAVFFYVFQKYDKHFFRDMSNMSTNEVFEDFMEYFEEKYNEFLSEKLRNDYIDFVSDFDIRERYELELKILECFLKKLSDYDPEAEVKPVNKYLCFEKGGHKIITKEIEAFIEEYIKFHVVGKQQKKKKPPVFAGWPD